MIAMLPHYRGVERANPRLLLAASNRPSLGPDTLQTLAFTIIVGLFQRRASTACKMYLRPLGVESAPYFRITVRSSSSRADASALPRLASSQISKEAVSGGAPVTRRMRGPRPSWLYSIPLKVFARARSIAAFKR